MIKTLTQSNFIDEMTFSKDSSYNNCFSYEGKIALFNYFEQLEEDTSEQIECDPIAICCDWCEYKNLKEVKQAYDSIKSLDDLANQTTYLELDNGGLLVMNF